MGHFIFITFLITFYLWYTNCITLFDAYKSYAIYDVWNITTVGKLELRFKTQSSYCLLLYVDDHHDIHQSEYSTNTITEGHFLEVSLIKGVLQITQQIIVQKKKHIKTIKISNELNDLKWHSLRLTKYVGTLKIEVDNKLQILTFSQDIAQKFQINSRLFIGGLSKTKIEKSYGTSKLKLRFVGCIEDLKYSSGTMTANPVLRFLKSESFAPKCLNACNVNPCQNSGTCINIFTRAGCDCFGTGHGGDRCNTPSETIHTKLDTFIKWDLIDAYSRTSTTYLRFRFKTLQSDGLIFYTKRRGFMLSVELVNGFLRVASGKASVVPKEIIIKKSLFDANWHSVVIEKKENTIITVVDDEIKSNLTINTLLTSTADTTDDYVYFGGLELPTKFTFGLKAKNNFVGCLQQIQYNKVDVIYKVLKTINRRIKTFGNIITGCPFNKSNIVIPTTVKPIPIARKSQTTVFKNPNGNEQKNNQIRAIHTRDNSIGQGVIVWITAAIVIGTIIIMISAACVVHNIRVRYTHKMKSQSSLVPKEREENQTEMSNINKTNKTSSEENHETALVLNDKSSEVDDETFSEPVNV